MTGGQMLRVRIKYRLQSRITVMKVVNLPRLYPVMNPPRPQSRIPEGPRCVVFITHPGLSHVILYALND